VRVLVVDDDEDGLGAVSGILFEAGADVRQARSAEAALDLLATFTPDVLVSDIAMPGRDGYWLIRRVRSMGTPSARVPAVALTAYSSPEDESRARAAGFQCHLPKPAAPEALASTVAELSRRAA
jgi:CheY-like chemotaxis protein